MDDDGCIPFHELPANLQSQILDRLSHVDRRLLMDWPRLKAGGMIPYVAEAFEAFVEPIEKAGRWDLVKCGVPWLLDWLSEHWAPPRPKWIPQRTGKRPLARPPGKWAEAYLRKHIGDAIRAHELKAAAHAEEQRIAKTAPGPVLMIPKRLSRSIVSPAAAERIADYLKSPDDLGPAALARKAGVTLRTLQRLLKNGKADRKTFECVAGAMGISLNDLLAPLKL
jgi:hypothetical protein